MEILRIVRKRYTTAVLKKMDLVLNPLIGVSPCKIRL
jgi:hypothetical protein